MASLPPTKSRPTVIRGDGHDEDSSSSLSNRARGSPHQGMWKDEVTHMAMAYDAGTEMGTGFSPDNDAEDPHMPISMIMCDSMAFCEAGEDIKPVAKITVTMM